VRRRWAELNPLEFLFDDTNVAGRQVEQAARGNDFLLAIREVQRMRPLMT